jgi:hypothetical protein
MFAGRAGAVKRRSAAQSGLKWSEVEKRTDDLVPKSKTRGRPSRAAPRLAINNRSGHGRAGGHAGYDGTGLFGTYAGYWPGRNGFPVNIGGG